MVYFIIMTEKALKERGETEVSPHFGSCYSLYLVLGRREEAEMTDVEVFTLACMIRDPRRMGLAAVHRWMFFELGMRGSSTPNFLDSNAEHQ